MIFQGKKKTVSIFLPVRAGSERVLHKNTRPFHSNGKSLFEFKLNQVEKLKNVVDEIIVSTNDKDIINQFPERFKGTNIRCIERPDELCASTTKVQDLINYVPEVTTGDVVLWLHVTSPFMDENDYKAALAQYDKVIQNGTGDS